MKASWDNTLLMAFFFVSVFIQNATLGVGSVQVGLIIVPIVLVGIQVLRGKFPVVKTRHFSITLPFLTYALLRAVTSPHLGEALIVLVYFGLDYTVMWMAYAFVIYARETGTERIVIWSVSGLMGLSVWMYFYLYLAYDPLELAANVLALSEENIREAGSFFDPKTYTQAQGDVLRFNGFYYDPNYWGLYAFTALYIVTMMKLSGSVSLPQSLSRRIWSYLAYIPPVLSCLFTFSRGSILGLVIVGIALLANAFTSNPRLGFKLLFGTGLGLSILVFGLIPLLYGDSMLKELLVDKAEGDFDPTTVARPFIWFNYLTIFSNWPAPTLLFGVGLNRLFYEDVGFFMSTHNYLLLLVASMGLTGLLLHLWMTISIARLISWARRRFRDDRLRYGVSLSFFIGLLVISFFIDPLYQFPYWLFTGVTFGMIQHDQFRKKSLQFPTPNQLKLNHEFWSVLTPQVAGLKLFKSRIMAQDWPTR